MTSENYESLTLHSGQSIFTWFKENWSKADVVVSIVLTIYLLVIVLPKSTLLFAILMLTPIYMLHEIEEYVFPGGFAQFMNKNIFKADPENGPLTLNAVFWINVTAIWIIFPLYTLWAVFDITQATAIAYILILQAIIHLILGIVGKRLFNPGMITAWLIHVPWATWTIWLLVQAKVVTNPFWNFDLLIALLIIFLALPVLGLLLVVRYRRRQRLELQ